jgi:osmotically-inducible protein OsmY
MSTKGLYALIGASILASALQGCAIFPKSSNPTADESITSDVQSRLAQHAEFVTPEFDVQTLNGVVYLNGEVYTGLQRRDAEAIALQANNVVGVVNNIGVTH